MFKAPPELVKTVMSMVCMLFGCAPAKKLDVATGKYQYDYWPASLKLLGSVSFLKNLMEYNTSALSAKTAQEVKRILKANDLSFEKAKSVSKAVASLLCWVKAVLDSRETSLVINPKVELVRHLRGQAALI